MSSSARADYLDDTGALAYAAELRPRIATLLRAAGLDVVWERGFADALYSRQFPRGVLDFAGGFGTTLFGHNHPALVSALSGALDARRALSAQMSLRARAGAAGKKLATLLERETARRWRVYFVSTGSEAVEAALSYCALDVATRGAPTGPHQYIAVDGAYHGRTSGAATLSGRTAPHTKQFAKSLAAHITWVKDGDVPALEATIVSLAARWKIAGAFVEPIQGEGGVQVLSTPFLRALRKAADTHGFPLVADEIQCGLGRSGRFLATSHADVVPDVLLLGKALGGSLTKLAALCVAERPGVAYHDDILGELEMEATSTFSDDDLSATVAVSALELIEREDVPKLCAVRGAHLGERLDELQARHPTSIAAVRGRGLMHGVALATSKIAAATTSPLLRVLCQEQLLAGVVAGHLLHEHGIRVAPTLVARSVLRLEPSAFVSKLDVERVGAALDRTLKLVDDDDALGLVAFLGGRPRLRRPTLPPQSAAGRVTKPATLPDKPFGVRRVGFLACFAEPADLARFDPSLAGLDDEARIALLSRVLPALKPFVGGRARLRSTKPDLDGARFGSGPVEVDVVTIGVPFLAQDAMRALREGGNALKPYRATLDDAVALAKAEVCSVLGFGGHTSILAGAVGLALTDPVATSGNALTAAAAVAATLRAARDRGLGRDEIRVGIVGAAGSIGAALAVVLAPRVSQLLLVGRPGSERRLDAVAEKARATSPDALVASTTELGELAECNVVVTASNAARPIVLAEHLGARAIVCDVAVPGDVAPELKRPDVVVLSGGCVRLPPGNDDVEALPGLDLGEGRIHGCLGETLLLGLANYKEGALAGSPTPERITRLLELAAEHGFVVDEPLSR